MTEYFCWVNYPFKKGFAIEKPILNDKYSPQTYEYMWWFQYFLKDVPLT